MLTTDQKQVINGALEPFGLTLDEYLANAVKGAYDVTMHDLGANYPAGPLPYGLKRNDRPGCVLDPCPDQEGIAADSDPGKENPAPDSGNVPRVADMAAKPLATHNREKPVATQPRDTPDDDDSDQDDFHRDKRKANDDE